MRVAASYPICRACGTQLPATSPLRECATCVDARQFVPAGGQAWTTLMELQGKHRNAFQQYEENVLGVGTVPEFAIGQRALLIRRPDGNILWDCISLIDEATVSLVRALGGISAIAISHPHYYTTMVEWSRAFADAPIYLHAADERWVVRPDAAIHHWHGDRLTIGEGVTLIRCGGHFEGGTVLHWADGADGRGALFTGDVIQVVADTRWVSFMYSYPNLIPLPASSVRAIADAVRPFAFERLYGAFWDRVVVKDARGAVERSATRYIDALTRGPQTKP